MCVSVRETWTARDYNSYHIKGPREDRALGYEALAPDDGSFIFYLVRVCGINNYDQVFTLP